MGLGNSLQLRMSTKCTESTRSGTAKARTNKCRAFTHKGPRASTTRSCRHVPANERCVGIRSYFTYRSVQNLKPYSGDLMFQNLILRTRLCGMMFITQPSCVVDFWVTKIYQAEMICIGGVPVLKRHFGGAGPEIFYMIHRGRRLELTTNGLMCSKYFLQKRNEAIDNCQ